VTARQDGFKRARVGALLWPQNPTSSLAARNNEAESRRSKAEGFLRCICVYLRLIKVWFIFLDRHSSASIGGEYWFSLYLCLSVFICGSFLL